MGRIRRSIAILLVAASLFTTNFSQLSEAFAKEKLEDSTEVKQQFSNSFNQLASTNIKKNSDKKVTRQRIIIKYKDYNKAEKVKSDIKQKVHNYKFDTKNKSLKSKIEAIEIESNENDSIINELKKDPNVLYVQEDYKLYMDELPSDSDFNKQWGLLNNGQAINGEAGTIGVDVDLIDAWHVTSGNSVTVGVLDTGIDIGHEDLKNNIYINSNELLNGKDDDGNGYIDDINGWNFVNNEGDVFSYSTIDTHGTHVAGIIAAEANNLGIRGVAPEIKILPLKFINGTFGYTSDAIEAIEYAQKMGVKIINCSWGGSEYNHALKDAIQNSGILFVCAAGNRGQDIDINPVYPAGFDLPNIITVSSVNNKGNISTFSNYGLKSDIAAPGENIISTIPGNKYNMMSGTSMAAPYVSGTASLILSQDDLLSPDEIKSRIIDNCDKYKQLNGLVKSSGIVNAFKSVGGNPKEARRSYNDGTTSNGGIDTKDNQGITILEKPENMGTGSSHDINDTEIKVFAGTYSENLNNWLKYAEESNLLNKDATSSSAVVSDQPSTIEPAATTLDYNNSSVFYKLKPKYLNTNFTFEMMSATVTNNEHSFKNIGSFRTRNDLCGMTWETVDTISHKDLRYPTNSDFTGVKLHYDYSITGYTSLMNSNISPTLTVETNDGNIYFVRLWNYVINRPHDDWETGASNFFNSDKSFPQGRNPGNANGSSGTIEIDFDNLYAGWSPYYWKAHLDGLDEQGNPIYTDEWVANPDWRKIPVNDIKKIMWSFVPTEYSYQSGNLSYLDNSYRYEVDFNNWYVTGNTYLGQEPVSKQTQSIRICDDYDDIYNMTPERVVEEYSKLGYGGIVDFYIGASHYYDKEYNGNKMDLIESYPFNNAFENWYKDYLKRLREKNTEVINSVSMECVDAPESWWQRTWDGVPATTDWTPVPHLLSFVNYDVKMFYKSYVQNLARLSTEQGLTPKIQLGEPWWWYIDNGNGQIPCFYDSATRYQFMAEKGYPIYEFKGCDDDIKGHEDVLYWLRDKNGEFSHFLRDSVKAAYPSAQFSVLFFPPSVMDKDRVTMMMSIVNFPKEHWKYPNLDFFMLEDYDYLIDNKMDKHNDALTFVQKNLGYPEEKIHYFSGFVLNEQYKNVWNNVNQALNDGFNQGFAETYVWAYAQVKRDGWKQPAIILSSNPSGNYSDPLDIELSCAEADKIIYTTDGTEPSIENGLEYNSPIHIEQSTTIKAMVLKNGYLSPVMCFPYTLPLPEPIDKYLNVDEMEEDWRNLSSLCIGSGKIFDLTVAQDQKKLYLLARGSEMDSTSDFYIDIDMKSSTGFNIWAWNGSGAEYLLEDSILYKYAGTGSDWNWTKVGNIEISKTSSTVEAAVNLADIGLNGPKEVMVAYSRSYQDFAPMVGRKMAISNTLLANRGEIRLGLNEDGEEYLDDLVAEAGGFVDGDVVTLNGKTIQFDDSNSRTINGRRVVNIYYFTNVFNDEIKMQDRILALNDPYFIDPTTGVCATSTDEAISTLSASIVIEPAVEGTTSENVRKIQLVLQSAGYWYNPDRTYSTATANGHFGVVTKESLIRFQTEYMKIPFGQLFNSNGIYCGCGPATAAELTKLYNKYFGATYVPGKTVKPQPLPTIIVGNTVIDDIVRRRDGSIWANFSQMADAYSAGGATNLIGRPYVDDEVTIECYHEDTLQTITKTYKTSQLYNVPGTYKYLYYIIQMAKDLGYGDKIRILNKKDGSQVIYIDCNRKLSDFEKWMNEHVYTEENINAMNALNFALIALQPEIALFTKLLTLSATMKNSFNAIEYIALTTGKTIPEVIEELNVSTKFIQELETLGIKFTKDAIVGIVKTPAGKITWLEVGSESAGLRHIMLRHSSQFAQWGLTTEAEVSEIILNTISKGGGTLMSDGTMVYDVIINGVTKQMKVVTGSNGFIVTAYPFS